MAFPLSSSLSFSLSLNYRNIRSFWQTGSDTSPVLIEDLEMNHKESLSGVDTWKNTPFLENSTSSKISKDHPSFTNIINTLNHQKWADTNVFDYDVGMESQFREFNRASESNNQAKFLNKVDDQMMELAGMESQFREFNRALKSQSSFSCNTKNRGKILEKVDDQMMELETIQTYKMQDWDPRAMMNNLSFLERKIHQLQDLVHQIVDQRSQIIGKSNELMVQQQQLVTADITSIIVQLISTAGSLLPSAKNISNLSHRIDQASNEADEPKFSVEEHDTTDEEEADEGENLPPGSYEILQLEKEEILAPHTHFCTICGKGFKRDANLRMHMRGHGDEYKTPAALAKPIKDSSSESLLIKRYSCPYNGCKRNKDHKKFQPLKTILCVKNHYKRTHCDKSYTCSKCNAKKFSVIADLKTHEKHCGKDKWLCSCGTTFSRKDKLFGHIALFQGHTPAILIDESKGIPDRVDNIVSNFNFGSIPLVGYEVENLMDVKGVDDPTGYFSPLNFDPCSSSSSIDGFHEFPRPQFNDPESPFSYLLQGSKVKL